MRNVSPAAPIQIPDWEVVFTASTIFDTSPAMVAMIAAGSPAAEIADPLFELFDAVTDTFRLHRVEGAVR